MEGAFGRAVLFANSVCSRRGRCKQTKQVNVGKVKLWCCVGEDGSQVKLWLLKKNGKKVMGLEEEKKKRTATESRQHAHVRQMH